MSFFAITYGAQIQAKPSVAHEELLGGSQMSFWMQSAARASDQGLGAFCAGYKPHEGTRHICEKSVARSLGDTSPVTQDSEQDNELLLIQRSNLEWLGLVYFMLIDRSNSANFGKRWNFC